MYSPSLPNISTPKAAKMKNRRKKSNPRFPTFKKITINILVGLVWLVME
jgi:hypothetical protein